MKVEYVTWSEALKMCYTLAGKVLSSGEEFDIIIAISRGGLVPARIVSDVLAIDELRVIRSRFWGIGSTIHREPILDVNSSLVLEGKNVLIVDEVVDTGATMSKVVKVVSGLGAAKVRTATLHYKVTSSFVPDYYVVKVVEWVWILYPWSLSETLYSLLKVMDADLSSAEKIMKSLDNLNLDMSGINKALLVKSLSKYISRET